MAATLYAHAFEWYCEAIGLEAARKMPADHNTTPPSILGVHEVNYEGEADKDGGHRIVLTSTEDGSNKILKCPCGARVRRAPMAPVEIRL